MYKLNPKTACSFHAMFQRFFDQILKEFVSTIPENPPSPALSNQPFIVIEADPREANARADE